jgi:hypothetical protein
VLSGYFASYATFPPTTVITGWVSRISRGGTSKIAFDRIQRPFGCFLANPAIHPAASAAFRVAQVDLGELGAAVDEVDVAVVDVGDDRGTLQNDAPGVRSGNRQDLGGRSDAGDAVAADRDGLGPGLRRVDGVDMAVDGDQVCLARASEGGAPAASIRSSDITIGSSIGIRRGRPPRPRRTERARSTPWAPLSGG